MYLDRIQIKNTITDEHRNNYVFSLPLVRCFSELKLHAPVTFFVGENGTGKSTLLEAIAINYGFNPEGGSRNFRFSTKETHSILSQYLILSKGVKKPTDGFFLRAESFYNVATEIESLDEDACLIANNYGGKSLHSQSHGESFLSLIKYRFRGNGLYLLDEPEAALSPNRQMGLLTLLHDFVKKNSQFIICTHSPILLAYPDAEIYVINETGLHLTPYEETEPYFITKAFLANPQRMLRELLSFSE